jgi:hypothetical protein
MSKNAQRLSQLVSTFGPGAMVDLATRSVVVGGLEFWEMRGDAFRTIPEPRLTTRLEQLLKAQGRLEQRLVEELSAELVNVQSVEDIAGAKKFNSKIAATLGNHPDAEVFARLQRIREGAKAESAQSPKVAEFDVFASGRLEIGHNHPIARLYAQTLPRETWADLAARLDLSPIKNLVAVHRLREVSCLYGFTRFEAAPTSADGTSRTCSSRCAARR